MKINRVITGGLAVLALTAAMNTSAAMIKHEGDAVRVDTTGLNLESKEGQEILYSRLEQAAEKLCGATSIQETGSLARALSNRSCVKETLTKAVESVGSKTLNEIHKTS